MALLRDSAEAWRATLACWCTMASVKLRGLPSYSQIPAPSILGTTRGTFCLSPHSVHVNLHPKADLTVLFREARLVPLQLGS